MGILLRDEEIKDATKNVWARHDELPDSDFWDEIHQAVAKAQLKKVVEELESNGWVLARKKDVNGAWILDLVGWEQLEWQSLKEEAGV